MPSSSASSTSALGGRASSSSTRHGAAAGGAGSAAVVVVTTTAEQKEAGGRGRGGGGPAPVVVVAADGAASSSPPQAGGGKSPTTTASGPSGVHGRRGRGKPGRQPGARFALAILTAINLLNYIDRYVPSSVKDLLKADLHLTDAQTSWPLTGMILVYMIASPFFGWVSDHELVGRRPLLTGAVVFWSAATALAAMAKDLTSLIALRSLVGVGEACYVVIATPMICDYFPPKERNVALGIFYLAIPVGAAIGYVIGGVLGQAFGWRAAFLFCGVPGILVGFAVLLVSDPPRGVNDDNDHYQQQEGGGGEGGWRKMIEDYKLIFGNHHFTVCLAGVTASTFALGALADWMATFLHRYRGMDLSSAGLVIGAATVVGGVAGLFLGASVSDWAKRRGVKNAYFLVPALFTLPATVLSSIALNVDNALVSALVFCLAEVFTWTYNAPISVIGVNSLSHDLRARGTGAQIFIQHILGDVISPPIVGAISDSTGSLKTACQMLPGFILLSGLFWLCGYLCLPELPSLAIKKNNNNSEDDEDEEHTTFFKVLCERESIRPPSLDIIKTTPHNNREVEGGGMLPLMPIGTPNSSRHLP